MLDLLKVILFTFYTRRNILVKLIYVQMTNMTELLIMAIWEQPIKCSNCKIDCDSVRDDKWGWAKVIILMMT